MSPSGNKQLCWGCQRQGKQTMWYLKCFSPSPQQTSRDKSRSWGPTMDAHAGARLPASTDLHGTPSPGEEASLRWYPEAASASFCRASMDFGWGRRLSLGSPARLLSGIQSFLSTSD